MSGLVSIGGLNLYGVDANGCSWLTKDLRGWGSVGTTLGVDQFANGDGGIPSQSWRKPRIIGVDVNVAGPSTAAVAAALDGLYALLAASPTLSVDDGLGARTAVVMQQDEVLPVWVNDHAADVSFQMIAPDSRKFGTPVAQSTALPSSTGGLTYPVTYPITYPAVQVTGVVSINNPGNAKGPVVLRINGPVQGPSITHLGTGVALTFSSSLTLNAGEWLDVFLDDRQRKVLANGQSSRNNTVTSRGWFGLESGSNQFAYNAVAYNSSTSLLVTATPAWF